MGVFLGDEVCCHVPKCLNATIAPVARRIRAKYAGANKSKLFIWSNECDSSIIGGPDHNANQPLPLLPGAIPQEIDIFSVDIYAGFGNDTFPGSHEVLSNVSTFYNNEIFPRMVAEQRAFVVPGFFGCSNYKTCGTLKQQEARLRDKLAAYKNFLATEPRVVGVAPWHADNRGHAGCSVDVKAKCNDCDMMLGAEAFPTLLQEWHAFGTEIVQNATTAAAATS